MAKISVIVPVYKVEAYLHRCMDSILNQSFSDFDVILVDDGSPDNCGSICEDYAETDSRVHVIHQKNGGLSAARNTGIDWAFANSDSEWLTCVDSDDWIHRDYLQRLYTAAESNGTLVSVCGFRWADSFVEDAPMSDGKTLVLDAEQVFSTHYNKSLSACLKLVKKELYEGIRFPVGKLYEDAFVTHKLIFACEKIAVVDEKMYYYYSNPTSITRSKWSDRMLDSIEAHEQRLEYFREKGLRKAYNWEQKIYIQELTFKISHLVESRESPREHLETLRMMQGKLRRALKRARKDKAFPLDREVIWAYLFAMKTDLVWKAAMGLQKCYHTLKK